MVTVSKYAQTVNEQDNPNRTAMNRWGMMTGAVGGSSKTWASSQYTRTKKGKYVAPWTVTAHEFKLDIPENAYVNNVTIEVRMRRGKGITVTAPLACFMVYGGKGKVSEAKAGKTGWHNNTYWVYNDSYVTKSFTTFKYNFSGKEWNKMGYPTKQLNNSIMGVDLVFSNPSSMAVDSCEVDIDWVRITVDYDLPDYYLLANHTDELNPLETYIGDVFSVDFEFGNRSNADGDFQNVLIDLPLGVTIDSYNVTGNCVFGYQDGRKYGWLCSGYGKVKSTLHLNCRATTLGLKDIRAYLDNLSASNFVYSLGNVTPPDLGDVFIQGSDVQKLQPACFDFIATAVSADESISYTVVVDGENQADASKISQPFKDEYSNSSGTGNYLVNWELYDVSAMNDVSIEWEHTDNNTITFNIPKETEVDIRWKGCFIPVTVGENTLYVTNGDTGDSFTYEYTSIEPKSVEMEITTEKRDIVWYDYWLLSQLDSDLTVVPFRTKDTDAMIMQRDCSFTMHVQKRIGYIGCVPVEHPHFDPKSDFDNDLLKQNYKNKKYLGKSGILDEKIDLNIRLPPRDWTTLQGLAELDKPVPIDLVPTAFEGDVLNHRGWVELYGVKDVEKTNPLYYKGKLDVEYLTHNINSRFQINRGNKLLNSTEDVLKNLQSPVLSSGDEFAVYYYKDSQGNTVFNDGYFTVDTDGVYLYDDGAEESMRTLITMDNNQFIKIRSNEPLSQSTLISMAWNSTKIDENRENYIERIIRIVDKSGTPLMEYQYFDYDFNHIDGIYNASVRCTTYTTDDIGREDLNKEINFASDVESLDLVKDSETGKFVLEQVTIDDEDDESVSYVDPITGETVDIEAQPLVYNDYIYSSTIHFELLGNELSIIDEGFNGREIVIDELKLVESEYYFEVEFRNLNNDGDTNDVLTFFDFEVQESILATDLHNLYSDLVVSSFPIPKKEIVYLRESEEGMMYYYKNDGNPFTYIQTPFYMYSKGVDLTTGDGQSIFNLNNSYVLFYVQNGLVRIGFNRLNGQIYLSKYDFESKQYINVAILQLNKFTDFKLGSYSDDKIEIEVSQTTFTVYRGHPYVVVKHGDEDIAFTTVWNKVYSDSLNDSNSEFPVLWELVNSQNLLPSCVAGTDLKASCLDITAYENESVGTSNSLTLTKVVPSTVYTNDYVVFSVSGSASDIDEEIPVGDGEYQGTFGLYTCSTEIDNSVAYRFSSSVDNRIIQTGDKLTARAKVEGYTGEPVVNHEVRLYETFTPELKVEVSKDIIQTGDKISVSVAVVDSDDGSKVKLANQTINLYIDE